MNNINLMVIKDVKKVSEPATVKNDNTPKDELFQKTLNNVSKNAKKVDAPKQSNNVSDAQKVDGETVLKDNKNLQNSLNGEEVGEQEIINEQETIFVTALPIIQTIPNQETIVENTASTDTLINGEKPQVKPEIEATPQQTKEGIPILKEGADTPAETGSANKTNVNAAAVLDVKQELTKNLDVNTAKNLTNSVVIQADDTDTNTLQFVSQVLEEVDDIINKESKTPNNSTINTKNVDFEGVKEEPDAKDIQTVQPKTILEGKSDAKTEITEKSYIGTEKKDTTQKELLPKTHNNMVVSADINSDGKVDFKLAQVQDKSVPIIEKASIFEQIVQQAKAAMSKNQTELFVQLKPAHLGGLIVSLSMGEQGMIAKLVSGQKDVALMIQTDMAQLQEALKEKGINVVHMDVIYDQMANSTNKDSSNFNGQWSSNTNSKGIKYESLEDTPIVYDNLSMYDVLTEQGGSVEYKA